MSTEENEWDIQAAEYVLGTLTDDEHKVLDALYKVDEDWQRRVHAWQARLNPLHESTPPVEPPASVLAAVLSRINEEPLLVSSANESAKAASAVSAPDDTDQSVADYLADFAAGKTPEPDVRETLMTSAILNQWKERVRYWQLTTLVAVVSLIGVLVVGPKYFAAQTPDMNVTRTVAVLQGEAFQPLWAVSYSPRVSPSAEGVRATVSVTVVGQPQLSIEDQSHQLWMVLPEGAGVQSVGLLPNKPGETIAMDLPIGLDEAAEFAVSIEPLGGVPGPEHGPVVARTFIVEPATQTNL
ncbi:MAG: anti-sigma factor [Granulosicoccus sp.]